MDTTTKHSANALDSISESQDDSSLYDSDGFKQGNLTTSPIERRKLGSVQGASAAPELQYRPGYALLGAPVGQRHRS